MADNISSKPVVTEYVPPVLYHNIKGNMLNVREAPGTNNSVVKDSKNKNVYVQINADVEINATYGNWGYSKELGGWIMLYTDSETRLRRTGSVRQTKTYNNLAEFTNTTIPVIDAAKNIGSIYNTAMVALKESQMARQDSSLQRQQEAARNAANKEGERAAMTQYGSGHRSAPYDNYVDPDWTPTDVVSGQSEPTVKDDMVLGPIKWAGEGRAAIRELQRISQMDFIIQPNLSERKRFNMFDRVGILDPTAKMLSVKEYVFFTKPDLNIYNNGELNADLAKIPIFVDADNRYREVLIQLQSSVHYTGYKYRSPFMNLLSNTIKSAMDLPTISAEETATAANSYGTAITYRDTSEKSDDGFEFSIEFEDTRYLEVYMLFKLYDEYERAKHLGKVSPKEKYIKYKVLHDQFAIYKFLVAEDGESIVYFAKYYGVYPKGVPRDTMNEIPDGKVRITIPFKCQFVEDMDPQILTDFNYLTNPDGAYKAENSMGMIDDETDMSNLRFGMVPFITKENIDFKKSTPYQRSTMYKLRWIEDINNITNDRFTKYIRKDDNI